MKKQSGEFVDPKDCKLTLFKDNYENDMNGPACLYGFRFVVNTIDPVGFSVPCWKRVMFNRLNKLVAMDIQSGNGYMQTESILRAYKWVEKNNFL
jgi:hypothetical protein